MKPLGSEAVRSTGRLREKARFKGPLATEGGARERALELTWRQIDRNEIRAAGKESAFVEVPSELLAKSDWRVVAARRFKVRDRIHVLEAAAAIWAVRRASRSSRGVFQRHLLHSDNMAVTCCFGKGRAADFRLLRYCRALCAYSIVPGVKVVRSLDPVGKESQ